jgi:hypothetical protein
MHVNYDLFNLMGFDFNTIIKIFFNYRIKHRLILINIPILRLFIVQL